MRKIESLVNIPLQPHEIVDGDQVLNWEKDYYFIEDRPWLLSGESSKTIHSETPFQTHYHVLSHATGGIADSLPAGDKD